MIMASLVIILALFWKPLYYLFRYLWSLYKTKDDAHSLWKEKLIKWGWDLLELITP